MIELKIDEFKDGSVTFHISRQDVADYQRLRHGPFILKLSDGKEYWLFSSCCPGYLNRDFFVRGSDSSMDNHKINVTFAEFLKIFELLKEYNRIS